MQRLAPPAVAQSPFQIVFLASLVLVGIADIPGFEPNRTKIRTYTGFIRFPFSNFRDF
jgi:hypothetical protein